MACEGYPVPEDTVDLESFDVETLEALDSLLARLLPAGTVPRPDTVGSEYPL